MDAWRGKDASVLQVDKASSGLSAKTPATGREDRPATFSSDAIVVVDVFSKKTGKTPKGVIETCKARLREYDNG